MVDEFFAEKTWYGPGPDVIRKNFDAYLKTLRGFAEGKNLPEGWVPATEFWVLLHQEVVGRIMVRHRLSPKLEKLGGHIGYEIRPPFRQRGLGVFALAAVLPYAARVKISRALLTCSDDNTGSIRIIEKCGGILQDKIQNPERQVLTRRYWIDLAPFK